MQVLLQGVRKSHRTGKTLQSGKCFRNKRYYFVIQGCWNKRINSLNLQKINTADSTVLNSITCSLTRRGGGGVGNYRVLKKSPTEPCTKRWLMISGLRGDVVNDPFYSCRSSQRGARCSISDNWKSLSSGLCQNLKMMFLPKHFGDEHAKHSTEGATAGWRGFLRTFSESLEERG